MREWFYAVSAPAADAILILLFFLSLITVAVALEKYILFRRDNPLRAGFRDWLVGSLSKHDVAGALKRLDGVRGINAAVVREGLRNYEDGPAAIEEVIQGRIVLERARLERRLIVLGTIGNNAPFIGLLGTVMGIIDAFEKLGAAATEGAEGVMVGISQALVATAVGLFVAIPAVILFNWLKSLSKGLQDEAESNARIVLAYAKSRTES